MKKLTLACALSLFAFSALAQRTFVSVSGLDTNPYSPTQPCRTIQQALNAVAAGGDVIMMDTGGFGNALSINKSFNILAPDGVFGVITGQITIAAGVTLKGDIDEKTCPGARFIPVCFFRFCPANLRIRERLGPESL
jgi:hypothetical protein